MRVVLLCLLILVASAYAKLPSYIKPCCKHAPTVNKCFVNSANEAVQSLKYGDGDLHIPSICPYLKHPGTVYRPNEYFYFKLFETQVYGLDTMRVVQAKCDFERNQIWFKFQNDEVKWLGRYFAKSLDTNDEVRGKAIIFVAKNIYEMNATYTVDSNNRMSVVSLTNDFVGVPKISYQLDNLNEHEAVKHLWEKTYMDFAHTCMVTYAEFVKTIWQQICSSVTFDELFPENCSSSES